MVRRSWINDERYSEAGPHSTHASRADRKWKISQFLHALCMMQVWSHTITSLFIGCLACWSCPIHSIAALAPTDWAGQSASSTVSIYLGYLPTYSTLPTPRSKGVDKSERRDSLRLFELSECLRSRGAARRSALCSWSQGDEIPQPALHTYTEVPRVIVPNTANRPKA